MDRAEFIRYLRQVRGVQDPCDKCQGLSVRSYSSTATWRGGIGGQAFTQDCCCDCWGSGDKSRPWTDIRRMEQERVKWEETEILEYLARRLGCRLSKIPARIEELAQFCDKQANRRKLPDGEE